MKATYHLVIKDSAHSKESVTQQWRKLGPLILSISQCEFYGASLFTYAVNTISLASIH